MQSGDDFTVQRFSNRNTELYCQYHSARTYIKNAGGNHKFAQPCHIRITHLIKNNFVGRHKANLMSSIKVSEKITIYFN